MIENTLNQQATDEIQLAGLYNLLNMLNRMQENINLIAANLQGQRITESGGNLFNLASEYYGDATLWTTLAQANTNTVKDANGFINPNLNGQNRIIFPPQPTQPPGGVLSV